MERKCTNISSLFVCCGFVILLFILVGYSGTKSDLDRLTKGYDDCGNICGKKNKDLNIPGCTYIDMTSKPKVEVNSHRYNVNITIEHYSCVEQCKPKYTEVFNRCFKTNGTDDDGSDILTELSQDLIKTWPKILLTCFVAFIFSYIVLLLFRYAIEYIIWIIYGSFIVLMIAGVIACLIFGIIPLAIGLGISAAISIFALYYFRKRIKLVAQLFKEASKALVDVPSIIFEPILTFLSLLLAIAPFIYFLILTETAGSPANTRNPDGTTHVSFVQDGGVKFAKFLNTVSFIWFTQFVLGCQHFVIAGTICKWYHIRDKTKLDSPVISTFSQLVRFHLGSICLGSMLITLVKLIRMLVNSLQKHARESDNGFLKLLACCLDCLLDMLEELLKYLIRNAYIIVAKDGTPLFESGKKAFRLIWDNLKDVVALNHFGDLVLVVGRLFITAISTFIAYEIIKGPEIQNVWFPVILCAIFSFLIAHCFISVFEMTIDTIFICFCDDIVENDGVTNPYYMSPELMDVMKKLKAETGEEFNFGNQPGAIIPQDPQPTYPPPGGMYPQNPQPYYPAPNQPYYPAPNQPLYPPMPNPQGFPYPPQPMYPNQPPQGGYFPSQP